MKAQQNLLYSCRNGEFGHVCDLSVMCHVLKLSTAHLSQKPMSGCKKSQCGRIMLLKHCLFFPYIISLIFLFEEVFHAIDTV